MFVEVSRLLIVLACTLAGLAAGRGVGMDGSLETVGGILGTLAGYVGGGIAGRALQRAFGRVGDRVEGVPTGRLFVGSMGAVVGGLGGAFLALPLAVVFPRVEVLLVSILIVWVCGALGAHLACTRSSELFAMAGLSTRPLVRAAPYEASDGHILDTSAVMDGRLHPLVKAGLLAPDLYVPRFVLDELQGFADAREGAQARRARRGLELLEELRREGPALVRVLDDEVPEREEVDAKLVALAKRLELRVLTCDVGLQRVAEIQGVSAVNLRKVADDLRPEHTPGDELVLELVKPGREPGQGVGYLVDGTMVVVNDGAELVGEGDVAVEVTTTVPTAVGRLVFARPLGDRAAVEHTT